MVVQQIFENEDAVLDEESIAIAEKMKSKNPNLPFEVKDDRLVFDAYTVGSIQVLDNVINILPRNPVFNLSTIFEMILFSNDIIVNSENTVGYEYTDQNGVWVIPKYFSKACKKLVDFGLTGGYRRKHEVSNSLQGDLILEFFNVNIIKTEGLHYNRQDYTLDIPANQIIKSALLKIIQSNQIKDNSYEFTSLLREFEAVSEYTGSVIDYKVNNATFYSCNPFYPEVVEIALTILKDMKLSFNKGDVQWYSFLQNSNNLFESYVRKLVSKAVDLKVQKWENPQNYASLVYNGKIGFKSYTPDILVGFDESTNSSKVVLDVKNKHFNPLEDNISELVEAADMYQLLFYCRKLKTKLGGLIYPAGMNYEPVSVIVDDDADLRIVLFSVNMKLNYRERLKKLKSDIFEALLKYL